VSARAGSPWRVRVVDSHTEGEPTRVVVAGGPDLGDGPLAERRERFRSRYDGFRRAVVTEPRGWEALVGALVTPPHDPSLAVGAIFFNNVGYLGMCGHGTIGLVATLAHLGRWPPGGHGIETPVGAVKARLRPDGAVSVENVPSYRHAAGVEINVPGHGRVIGDVAWGGNWFFLTEATPVPLRLRHAAELRAFAHATRTALERAGIAGANGAPIDHVELSGPPERPENHGRNFVLCPGDAYDRSPCGTGTSAKLACLIADGRWEADRLWRQEGILGTVFEARARKAGDQIVPEIAGRAYLTAESELLLDERDPFCYGVGP
jgi:4-hydroxyproline epimerase